jgi:hypothetical protein
MWSKLPPVGAAAAPFVTQAFINNLAGAPVAVLAVKPPAAEVAETKTFPASLA